MATIAHLSDIHFGRVDPAVVDALIDTLTAVAPDLVALSGDLTQRARSGQFRAARRFLDRLPRSLLVVPGNHDVPLFNLAARLSSARAGAIKIVVTHHPFDLPDTHGDEHLVGRSDMAMRRLADAGADVFLAGHLHVSHIGHTAARYQIAGHSALVVQAGTLSTRQRGEVNSINLLRLDRERIDVDRYAWDGTTRSFQLTSNRTFHRGGDGWFSR